MAKVATGSAGRLDISGLHDPSSQRSSSVLLSVPPEEILRRLTDVERRLSRVITPMSPANPNKVIESPGIQSTNGNVQSPGQTLKGDPSQTFVGEMSAFHSLHSRNLEPNQPRQVPQLHSPASSHASIPSDTWHTKSGEIRCQEYLNDLLDEHQVRLDRAEFDVVLQKYLEQVHILNPLLDVQWLEAIYEDLWHQSFRLPLAELANNYSRRLSVAIVFLCLGSGACQESSSMDPKYNCHTAGYNLYNIALQLLRPLLDPTQDHPVLLQSLQALALTVLYLFRIDASAKAEKILAQAVCNAHLLGLHRESTYEKFSAYDDQMFRRTWWSIYCLDRKISVETGRPLAIQDINVCTKLPLNVTNEWLAKVRDSGQTLGDLAAEIDVDMTSSGTTDIPYLSAMVSYSRIVGDMWKILYAGNNSTTSQHGVGSYLLDVLIATAQDQLPSYLRYDPSASFEDQFGGMQWCQIKQAILIHMRYAVLKVIVRRSAFNSNSPGVGDHDEVIEQAECVKIAAGLVEDYLKIPATSPRHMFPFYHYLTSATMIMLSVALKNPAMKRICRKPIIAAANALITDGPRTWVSEKVVHTVSRLSRKVQSGFLNDPEDAADLQGNKEDFGISSHHRKPQASIDRSMPLGHTTSAAPSHPVGSTVPMAQDNQHVDGASGHGFGTPRGERSNQSLLVGGLAFEDFPDWTLEFEKNITLADNLDIMAESDTHPDMESEIWRDWGMVGGSIPLEFLTS